MTEPVVEVIRLEIELGPIAMALLSALLKSAVPDRPAVSEPPSHPAPEPEAAPKAPAGRPVVDATPSAKPVEVGSRPVVPRPLTQKTPQRVLLLRELRNRDPRPSNREICDRLNELPGATIPLSNIHSYFTQWGATVQDRKADGPAPAPASPIVDIPSTDRRMAPRRADREQIRGFCRQRGWQVEPFDLGVINAKCFRIGLPIFELIEAEPRGGGAPKA